MIRPGYQGKRPPMTATLAERIEWWSMPEPNSGCWLWLGTIHSKTGYGGTSDKRTGRKILTAHRASWEAFNERPVPPGKVVRHKCDVKSCVNPDHLIIGTQRDNIIDAVKRDLHQHKLTDEEVLEIYRDPRPGRRIAKDYKVTQANVWRIKNKKNWKHLLETV